MTRFNMKLCLNVLLAAAIAASTSGSRGLELRLHTTRRPFAGSGWVSRAFAGGADDTAGSPHPWPQHRLQSSATSTPTTLQDFEASSQALLASIVAVASDVDGTLTSPEVTVTDRTKDAIRAVLGSELLFFPATGKTRAGVYNMLGDDLASELKAKNTPGVFVQGLIVYAGAGDEVLFERLLDAKTVAQIESFCEERGVSLVAYSGDRIVCCKNDAQTDKVADYMEPMPEAVGPLREAMASGLRIHKLMLMDTVEAIARLRPQLERLTGDGVTFVQAMSDMLEVLPRGASKGAGVAVLLDHLGVDPARLMALGDAENDVGMLRLAGVGVCVGNATPPARAAARFIAPSNAEDGAAVAMERLLKSRPERK